MENDHAFSDILPPYVSKCKTGRLPSRATRYLYSFSLDGSHLCRSELAQTIGAYKYGVACVNLTRFDDTRNDSTNEWHRESIVDMELER